MARESKRKRDARRFGEPERLADRIVARLVWPPNYICREEIPGWERLSNVLSSNLTRVPVISADNVAAYAFGYPECIGKWDAIPAAPPPFPEFFVEATGPWGLTATVAQFGVWFRQADRDTALRFIGNTPGVEILKPGVYGVGLADRTKWFVFAYTAVRLVGAENAAFPIMKVLAFLGESGEFLVPPLKTLAYGEGSELAGSETIQGMALAMLNVGFLAVAFMHCSNVSTAPVEPERAVNRERVRGGLKPFIRYHTINIEPMKRVLRAEGNVEAVGLKTALHVCRGHFKTWATTYFGRPLGKPVTYWVPSHAKGSLKKGVVVSDYSVKAPGTD